jgi:hypothetical protein
VTIVSIIIQFLRITTNVFFSLDFSKLNTFHFNIKPHLRAVQVFSVADLQTFRMKIIRIFMTISILKFEFQPNGSVVMFTKT